MKHSDILGRFWAKVEPEPMSGCFIWIGSVVSKEKDYGVFEIEGRRIRAHRFAYEQAHGPIPDGLEPDHLCRFRRCVNEAHLELVTPVENVMRGVSGPALNAKKTACIRGHPFDKRNTRVRPNGKRDCRECDRLDYPEQGGEHG